MFPLDSLGPWLVNRATGNISKEPPWWSGKVATGWNWDFASRWST